jgi:hypothetical protein
VVVRRVPRRAGRRGPAQRRDPAAAAGRDRQLTDDDAEQVIEAVAGGQGVNTTDSKVELRWDVRVVGALTDRSATGCWSGSPRG